MSELGPDIKRQPSPLWNSTTKLVVGLTVVAVFFALIVRFNNIIAPLIVVFMLTYLLHPLASFIQDKTRMTWRMSVNIMFLVFLILIFGFITVSGLALINQLQNLIRVVQNFIVDLPDLVTDFLIQDTPIRIPVINFEFNVAELISQLNIDFLALSEQILSVVQPMLGQAGGLLGTLAASALTTLGWGAFIFIISYFIMADSGRELDYFSGIDLPGYMYDLHRLGRELGRTWNAFLRGQLIVFVMIIVTIFLVMTLLGVRNALGLAILAGLAKFIPYIGPFAMGVTSALVAFFQDGGNYLGIEPTAYALIVVGIALLLDQIFDNLVTPRIFGQTLGVHPAALLIAAIIAASLLGIVGLILAAPVLASLQLFFRYGLRKMLDQDPWPEAEEGEVKFHLPMEKPIRRQWDRFIKIFQRGKKK